MKKILSILLALLLMTSTLTACTPNNEKETDDNTETIETDDGTETDGSAETDGDETCDEPIQVETKKPVIYLYPETKQEINVQLDFHGQLVCTYPKYNNGWTLTAYPDGTLIDENGQTYSYIFWDGITDTEFDMSTGYVIAGKDTAEFLEEKLEEMGLNRKEANDFIVYWLPEMENNEYNLISFDTTIYTDIAKLEITPNPDSMLRVFMTFKALDNPIDIEEPIIEKFERNGFVVVEWGGAKIG